MSNTISIIGSTGSIGTQTIEVARNLNLKVSGLAAGRNIGLLCEQIDEFAPEAVAVLDAGTAAELKKLLKNTKTEIYYGNDGYKIIAGLESADTVVSAIVGIAGLEPTLEAVKKGKRVALANKETLVTGGNIVMAAAKESGAEILPVDSEHCAIFQCLAGNRITDVVRIILTASGGPFRRHNAKMLEKVTPEEALEHPNWNMGGKITIDSATLMNKGFEVIETHWLFGMDVSKVEVLIHPQSMIHSMVEFSDGSVMAQIGSPDMRIPIQFALTWPERTANPFKRMDFVKTGRLTFEKPDIKRFRSLKLAYDAAYAGGTMPVVLNGANEVATDMFMKGVLKFKDIPVYIERVMERHTVISDPDLFDILESDLWARRQFKAEVGR